LRNSTAQLAGIGTFKAPPQKKIPWLPQYHSRREKLPRKMDGKS